MSEERDGVSMSDQTEDAATQAIAGIIIRDVLQEEYDDLVEGYLEEILIASRRIMRLPAYAEVGKLFRERLDDAITYRDARIAALEGEVERLRGQVRDAVDGAQPLWSGDVARMKDALAKIADGSTPPEPHGHYLAHRHAVKIAREALAPTPSTKAGA